MYIRRRLQVLSRIGTEESRREASEEVQKAIALFDNDARPANNYDVVDFFQVPVTFVSRLLSLTDEPNALFRSRARFPPVNKTKTGSKNKSQMGRQRVRWMDADVVSLHRNRLNAAEGNACEELTQLLGLVAAVSTSARRRYRAIHEHTAA